MSCRIMFVTAVALALGAGCTSSAPAGQPTPAKSAHTAVVSGPTATSSIATGSSLASINPANFTSGVGGNTWFPLTPGDRWVYTGSKDGKPPRDVMIVTGSTRTILGVRCVVVQDYLHLAGKLAETTLDYYARDNRGNVWYFGEDTQELSPAGAILNTDGSWQAGVNGAKPGIIMTANPVIGQVYQQEYLPGQAQDHAKAIRLSASTKVPFASFSNAQLTQEWSPLEPNVIDHKYYVRGIGVVKEVTAKGPKEENDLVSFTKG
jgi:hypothetical protein